MIADVLALFSECGGKEFLALIALETLPCEIQLILLEFSRENLSTF
jgi:hypothetical protein